jgi:urate oxidase
MSIVLGDNQYGKAENRVVRIYRDGPRHEIRDINVSTSLRGNFADAHETGDQSQVLPTDTQKNTCFAYAKQKGIGEIENYALDLGRHFVDDVAPVQGARIEVDEYAWDRIVVNGDEHDHAWTRRGGETRTCIVTIDGDQAWVVSGLKDLTLLKSTGSEFWGYLKDEYTTLAETHDRVLATSLTARWRHAGLDQPWGHTFRDVRRILVEQFAQVHSLALQQTLWEMGKAVLEAHPEIVEIKLSAPNKHHFLVNLAPFGVDNSGEVFHAADRPYGLIECTVSHDDAPDAGLAWHTVPAFA